MTKGLFFAELDRYSSEKVEAIRMMMGTFAAAHVAYASKLGSMWRQYLTDMGLDATEMGEAAKATLLAMESHGDGKSSK